MRIAGAHNDEPFLLDPYDWVKKTILKYYCPEEDAGFFHVTTDRWAVLADGRLRSRSDTGRIGLGGGLIDPGHHISFVVNLRRAMWLWGSMRGLLASAKDGDAASVLRLVLEWTGFPGDRWSFNWDYDEDVDWMRADEDLGDFCAELGLEPPSDMQVLTSVGGWHRMIATQSDSLARAWPTPEKRYELAQFFEMRLESTFYIPEWWDDGVCVPLVGFTASPMRFLSVNEDDLSVCQAEVRRGAIVADVIKRECELRLSPDDVRLVAMDCQEGNEIPVPPRK